jgi:hypothetical protein
MASTLRGKAFPQDGKTDDPAATLEMLFPEPHRDKSIARAFGITTRMARYLRQGKHWTDGRKAQLALLLAQLASEQALVARLNELECQLAELRRLVRVGRAWE